jgi:hypothetical protein
MTFVTHMMYKTVIILSCVMITYQKLQHGFS